MTIKTSSIASFCRFMTTWIAGATSVRPEGWPMWGIIAVCIVLTVIADVVYDIALLNETQQ